jgi:hypothetical protein
MATKLMLKGDAANPEKWTEDFLAKVTAAGDHQFFTQQIWRKWWKKGFDDVFKGGGAQLDLSLDASAFSWVVKTLTDGGKKALSADKELAENAIHKGKCSGMAPKEPEKPAAKVAEKQADKVVEKPVVKGKPMLAAGDITPRVKSTPVQPGGKDDAVKYTARMKRTLEAEFDGVTEAHLKAVTMLAEALHFPKVKAVVAAVEEKPAKPTLTAAQVLAVDAALTQAQKVANGENLDIDQQVALGDAITSAFGGKYPTHSRGGGHKGSFNSSKTIQQQLSNIADKLTADASLALDDHLTAKWKKYSV